MKDCMRNVDGNYFRIVRVVELVMSFLVLVRVCVEKITELI